MQFQTENIDGVLVISTPETDLDASNADDFKKSIAPIIDEHSKVILNLNGIGFMDSAGLGAILSVYKKIRSEGGYFGTFGLSKEVKALFELVRMRRLFEVHDNKDSAINAAQT